MRCTHASVRFAVVVILAMYESAQDVAQASGGHTAAPRGPAPDDHTLRLTPGHVSVTAECAQRQRAARRRAHACSVPPRSVPRSSWLAAPALEHAASTRRARCELRRQRTVGQPLCVVTRSRSRRHEGFFGGYVCTGRTRVFRLQLCFPQVYVGGGCASPLCCDVAVACTAKLWPSASVVLTVMRAVTDVHRHRHRRTLLLARPPPAALQERVRSVSGQEYRVVFFFPEPSLVGGTPTANARHTRV
jgi:hypothetical protein